MRHQHAHISHQTPAGWVLPRQLCLDLERQFGKKETGPLQYQVAVVWPAGCLPAQSQGPLCQGMPPKGTCPSPSSSASLPSAWLISPLCRLPLWLGQGHEGPCGPRARESHHLFWLLLTEVLPGMGLGDTLASLVHRQEVQSGKECGGPQLGRLAKHTDRPTGLP